MNTFTVFLLLMVSIVPVVMIVFGYLFSNRPPKKVGSFLGYRTSRSILNEDTWRFAHHYCGKTWFVLGWLTLARSTVRLPRKCLSTCLRMTQIRSSMLRNTA